MAANPGTVTCIKVAKQSNVTCIVAANHDTADCIMAANHGPVTCTHGDQSERRYLYHATKNGEIGRVNPQICL